jgi:hypothetical protein
LVWAQHECDSTLLVVQRIAHLMENTEEDGCWRQGYEETVENGQWSCFV